MVCVLPWAQDDLFFLESSGWNIVLPSTDSSIWCSLIYVRFQGPCSDVPFPPWHLGLTWAPRYWVSGPSAQDLVYSPLTGFPHVSQQPYASLWVLLYTACYTCSRIYCFMAIVESIHLQTVHCSSYLLQLASKSASFCIFTERQCRCLIHPNSTSLVVFFFLLLQIKYHSHSISNLASSFSILWLKIIDVV